jgi:hypothetical protein
VSGSAIGPPLWAISARRGRFLPAGGSRLESGGAAASQIPQHRGGAASRVGAITANLCGWGAGTRLRGRYPRKRALQEAKIFPRHPGYPGRKPQISDFGGSNCCHIVHKI